MKCPKCGCPLQDIMGKENYCINCEIEYRKE